MLRADSVANRNDIFTDRTPGRWFFPLRLRVFAAHSPMIPETTTRVIGGFLIAAAIGALIVAGVRGLVPEDESLDKPRWLVIQEQFETGKQSTECTLIDSMLVLIEASVADRAPLPGDQIQTVLFPRRQTNPTVGDFARDRALRLMNHRLEVCSKEE